MNEFQLKRNLSHSKYNVILVGFFMILCYVGVLAQYTIMSQYIYFRISKDHNANVSHINISKCNKNNPKQSSKQSSIQTEVANYNIYSQLSSGIPSMITVVIYGILSDVYGRKPIILISWIGLLIGTIFNILLIGFDGPLWIYILGQFIAGLGGNYGAMLTGVLSLVSDSTTKKSRNLGISVIEFALGASMVISQSLLGLWLHSKDFFGPIITFGTLFFLSGVVWIFLKETRPMTNVQINRSSRFYLFISIVKMTKIFFNKSKLHIPLILTLTAFFLHTFNFFGNLSLITLYLFGSPFCWTADVLGYYRSIASAVVQVGTFLSLILLKYRVNEILIVEIGFITYIMSKVLFSIAPLFATNKLGDYIIYAASLDLFSGGSVSLLRSISSKLVTPDEHGSLFGVMSCLETLSSLTGGVVFNSVYEGSFIYYYGITYIFSAALLLVAFALMIVFFFIRKHDSDNGYDVVED